ncbi:serine hydrolase [Acidobacteriota bacterium]
MNQKGSSRLIFLILSFLLCRHIMFSQVPVKDLDETVKQGLVDWKVPGMALAIVKNGKVVYAKGFGTKNVIDKTLVDENTIFAIGSCSKAFGAAMVGILVQEGKVNWDDKVLDHMPDYRLRDSYVTREITLRDLLCHRSGVMPDELLMFGDFSRDEIVFRSRFLPQVSSFRSKYGYHNIMIMTSGQVVARVTGKSWDENVMAKIFKPLGMSSSSTSIRDFKHDGNISTPHIVEDGKQIPIPWLNIDDVGPAGCVNSTVIDMAKWVQLHLGEGTFQGKEIWSKSVQREMHSSQMITGDPVRTPGKEQLTHFSSYGLGWGLYDYRGRKVISHSGASDGMGAVVGMIPELNLGFISLQNRWPLGLQRNLMTRIFDAYLGVPEEEWTEIGKYKLPPFYQAKKKVKSEEPLPPSLSLEKYTGTYSSEVYGGVRVVLDEENLVLRFDHYPPAELNHFNRNTFSADFGKNIASMLKMMFRLMGSEATFKIDANAKVIEFEMPAFGVFKRTK